MQVYIPNLIFIPQEVKEHPTICCYLLNFFDTMKKSPNKDNLIEQFREISPDTPLYELASLEEKKDYLLSHNYPLFQDIFLREHAGGQQVIALGAEIERVIDFIGYPEIWHQGKRIPDHKISKREIYYKTALTLFVINSDHEMQFQAGDSLQFRWTKPFFPFKRTVHLQSYTWLDRPPKFTLNTLQKNNPLEWIRDWVLYHHRIHGVERVLFYDNNSQNRQELKEFLSQLESEGSENFEICFIPWDSIYAPLKLSFCQVSQINHAYYWLWDKASYHLNHDIDEYLVNHTGQLLADYMKRYMHRLNPTFVLSSRMVLPDRTKDSLSLVTDLTQILPPVDINKKHMMLGGQKMHGIWVHNAYSVFSVISLLRTYVEHMLNPQKAQRIPGKFICKIGYWRFFSRLACDDGALYSTSVQSRLSIFASNKPVIVFLLRIAIFIVNCFPFLTKYFFGYRKIEWGLYFYHYHGLNSGWSSNRHLITGEGSYEDTEMLETLKKAGVGKYYSE